MSDPTTPAEPPLRFVVLDEEDGLEVARLSARTEDGALISARAAFGWRYPSLVVKPC